MNNINNWLEIIKVYQPHHKRYRVALELLKYCADTERTELVDKYIRPLVVFDGFTFIESLEILHDEFGIDQHSIGLFLRESNHFKSITDALLYLKKQGIYSHEITELMVSLYESCNHNSDPFFPNFDTNLLSHLTNLYRAEDLNPSVVTLLKISAPALQESIEALSLLKTAGLYKKEYIDILSYRDALYPVEYAKALILLQEAHALNQETLTYFKYSGLPYEFLSSLEKVNHAQQLNAESAKWIMTTRLGYHSESELLAFIELNKAKIQFDVADLLSKKLSEEILIITRLNSLTQDVYNALKTNSSKLGVSFFRCLDYLEEKNIGTPELILRLCNNELKLNQLYELFETVNINTASQEAMLSQGFIHNMNKQKTNSARNEIAPSSPNRLYEP
ncbi:hypothetical protein Lgra_2818 [Legionella gratiana]|uniref:Uncharacterized protein n=1 Tax=Legionella gratiana TaxID=45066 RepID=A0A378J4M1_9GAMM|nr:hypothetical protein [Legionella gratiana]KTD06041.1 hypothetical protein Lgra_2818 [Legionella gratiana]STX42714.1 Uncharacterised protein [Legionella gratiana]